MKHLKDLMAAAARAQAADRDGDAIAVLEALKDARRAARNAKRLIAWRCEMDAIADDTAIPTALQ